MEKEEIEGQLDFYASVFNDARDKVNDEQVALAIVEQVGKDMRMKQIFDERRERLSSRQDSGSESNDDRPATEKQIGYLRRLGVKEIPAGLTKKAASQMIDEALENESE